jgi:pSer/pThr/pTyr-binding forkhead associated (FHA) protein
MAIRLTVTPPGGQTATELDFDQERVRSGRGAMCDVRLPALAVSAVHAMVTLDRDRYYVVDLGSTNGTTINGEALVVDRRKLLRSGDTIGISGFELRIQAGVAMLSPHCQERTVAAARQLARQVMEGGSGLRRPAIVVLSGPQAGDRFELPPAPARLVIGRDEESDVVLVDGEASRRHAEIEISVEGVTIRDLGGKNPVMIGEREVTEARLHDRVEFLVGSTALALDEPVEAFLRDLAERPESDTLSPPPERAVDADPDEPQASPEPTSPDLESSDEHPSVELSEIEPELLEQPRTTRRHSSTGSEIAVLLVGALALAACVAALVWLFR